MILTPEDEQGKGLPSRITFTGVGSSRPSLCASPDDDKAALDVEKEDGENIGKDHSDYQRNKSPVTSENNDNRTSEHEIVDNDDDQFRSDHHEDDVDAKVVSGPNHNDNDFNERRTDPEKSEDEDDVGNKQDETRYSDNNVNGDDGIKCPIPQNEDDVGNKQDDSWNTGNDVNGDDGIKCPTPQNEDGVVDDSGCDALSDDKPLPVMQQDEYETLDDDHRDPSLFHLTNESALTNPASNLQDSMSADPRDSSSPPPPPPQTLELNQQGSTRSLRSSTSRQHGESSRRYSDSSQRTIRSEQSSSGSSSVSSSASSTESSSGSDSGSSSSDSNSDSESYSSSSSSSSSSGSDSCSSDSACSSSSGNESNSSSDGERESDDIDAGTKYRIASEKYERVSSRDSGRSSSFSFASARHTDMKTKRKSRGKRLLKPAKSHHTKKTQHGKYKERVGEVHQETCSTVCVLL